MRRARALSSARPVPATVVVLAVTVAACAGVGEGPAPTATAAATETSAIAEVTSPATPTVTTTLAATTATTAAPAIAVPPATGDIGGEQPIVDTSSRGDGGSGGVAADAPSSHSASEPVETSDGVTNPDAEVSDARDEGFSPTADDPVAGTDSAAAPQPLPALRKFDDCQSLLAGIRAEASRRVGPYGVVDRRGLDSEDRRQMTWAASDYRTVFFAGAASDDERGDARGERASGSQNADIVKSDGRRIVTVTNQTYLTENILTVADIGDPDRVTTEHVSLGPDARIDQLLLHGDRALVIGDDSRGRVAIDEILLEGRARRGRALRVDGRYVGAGSLDGMAYIVVASEPDESKFVFPVSASGEETATVTNRLTVQESTLADWLPEYVLWGDDGSTLGAGNPLACGEVYVPTEFLGYTVVSVLAVDLEEPLAISDGVAVMTDGAAVYASHEHLYLATLEYLHLAENSFLLSWAGGRDDFLGADHDYRTSIHMFSLRSNGPPLYKGSGSVEGHLRGSSSLHEFGGSLFTTTTIGPPWSRDVEGESRISVLRHDGGVLSTVGLAGDVGRGERILAVRYIADRAYLESFSKDGLLRIVDLGDPRRPVVTAELVVPGYSTPSHLNDRHAIGHLHPLGDGLLAGVGAARDPTGEFIDLYVSLFDVANAASPGAIDAWVLRTEQPEDLWNQDGVLWWAPEQLLIVPTLSWQPHVPAGAVALRVDPAEGLERLGYVALVSESPSFLRRTDCYHEFNYNAVLKDSWASIMEARGAALLLVCASSDSLDRANYTCEALGLAEAARQGIDVDSLPMALHPVRVDLREYDRLEFCWEYNTYAHPSHTIVRSLVIADRLWTLGYWWLQSNDLDTLERRVRVDLPTPY